MTNSAARVGVNRQVSFWVALADIGAVAEVKAESPAETIPVAEKTYTVKAGDSLWAIAAKQLGNGGRYKEIMSLNGLKDDVIYAGQMLKLPKS